MTQRRSLPIYARKPIDLLIFGSGNHPSTNDNTGKYSISSSSLISTIFLPNSPLNPRSDWTRGVGSPTLQLQNGVPKVPFLQVGRTQRSPRKVFVTKWQSKLTHSYEMVPRFCSTRIRSHPFARFALYKMVGTGGGYTRTILGSLGSNLQQPGQPESRFIFPVLLRSSVCFGVMLYEWPN